MKTQQERALEEAFFKAVRLDNRQEVERLLDEEKVDINCTDSGNYNALFRACSNKLDGMARLLIARGINLHYAPQSGIQAICYAAKFLPDLAIDMLDMEVDPNAQDKDGLWVPLIVAIEEGHDKLANRLLEKGASASACNNVKEPAIMVAALKNRRMFRPLLAAGASPDQEGRPGVPVIHQLVQRLSRPSSDILTALLMLVGAGANMSATDDYFDLLPKIVRTRKPELGDIVDQVYRSPRATEAAFAATTVQNLLHDQYSLLDNPRTWWMLDELLSALAENGEQLDIHALLQDRQAPDGTSYLEYGIRCAGFAHVQTVFAKHGMPIAPELLVDANREATPLLQRVIQNRELGAIFNREYWRQHPMASLKRIYNALPEAERLQLPYHQLLGWKGAQASTMAKHVV